MAFIEGLIAINNEINIKINEINKYLIIKFAFLLNGLICNSYFKDGIITIDDKQIVVKIFEPFLWICNINNIEDMKVITFSWNIEKITHPWSHKRKNLFNAYFNGKIFGYSEKSIYKFYESMNRIDKYTEHANEYYEIYNYIQQMPEYKLFVDTHYNLIC